MLLFGEFENTNKKISLAFFEYEINSVGFNRERRRNKINENKAELVRRNHIGDVCMCAWVATTTNGKYPSRVTKRGFSEIARACTYPNFWSA